MKTIFIAVLFVCTRVLFAQTGYVHTTNTITCELVDNGIIGENTSGTYSGLTYLGGSNVIYSGGIVATTILFVGPGTDPPYVVGMCGSYDLNDFINVVPFSGFTFDTNFDQIGKYTYNWQDTPNNLYVNTFSRNDQSVIYIRQTGFLFVPTGEMIFYAGIILDFDIGDYANNSGGYDPERNLIYMYDASPSPSDTNYYGVVLLNVDPNSLHGKLIQNYNATNEEIANYCINTDFSTPPDTADHRLHISMPGIQVGVVGQWDFAIVCGTSLADLLNTVDNTVIPYGAFLPVELTSFTAQAQNQKVILKWTTATELNNNGFEIQRKVAVSEFATIGFVRGEGTTTDQKEYSFTDKDLINGKYFYRLKQIDYNGSFEYSDVVEVEVLSIDEYSLEQNFPNPFNPITTIGYVLKEKSNARLTLLNAIGEEVAVLVNEEQDKGFHKVDFNAANLPSGVYFYRLQAGDFVQTKKMILLR